MRIFKKTFLFTIILISLLCGISIFISKQHSAVFSPELKLLNQVPLNISKAKSFLSKDGPFTIKQRRSLVVMEKNGAIVAQKNKAVVFFNNPKIIARLNLGLVYFESLVLQKPYFMFIPAIVFLILFFIQLSLYIKKQEILNFD